MLGAYEIVSPLGSGGMGEMYRARDRKLGREVAIKVLPEAVERDADRIARFEREAKVLALLNHSHIAALYGMDLAGDRHFLIMELVEGETLADRIRRPEGLRLPGEGSGRPSGLPIDEALRIAIRIADALEAAHEKGIIHRDFKPANVKISRARAVHPVWSRDGRELVSQPQGGQQFAVHTITTRSSFAFSASVPVPRGGAVGLGPALQRNYDVMPDGRILGVIPSGQTQAAGPTTQQIQVVLNWFEELKARVPTP